MTRLRRFLLVFGLAYLVTLYVLVPPAHAASTPPYLSFAVPHSAGTYPLSINKDLTITGYYIDTAGNTHGFVRYFDGHIDTIDVPGGVLTKPVSINAAGIVTGYYEVEYEGALVPLGFTRDRYGDVITFGDTSFFGLLTQPVAINNSGEIAGNFPSLGLGSFSFVRSATGTVETFSITDGAAYSTFLTGLNAGGAVVGYGGSDDLATAQGFLWNGVPPVPGLGSGYTEISFPGSTGTFPTGINKNGEIVGCYSIGSVYYDFVRATDGTFTTLSPSGTIPTCLANEDTTNPYLYDNLLPAAVSLNNRGTIIGYTTNAGVTRGFVRFTDETIVPFAIPGSTLTIPASINNFDVMTGYFTKAGKTEGFIALP